MVCPINRVTQHGARNYWAHRKQSEPNSLVYFLNVFKRGSSAHFTPKCHYYACISMHNGNKSR